MKDEMTKSAESQFAEANKHYYKLKSEFSAKSSESSKQLKLIDSLKSKLASAENSLQSLKESSENEIFKLSSSLSENEKAMSDASSRSLKTIQDLNSQISSLEDSKSSIERARDAIGRSLATERDTNDNLRKEIKELNDVCEELMAIVEGHEDNKGD